MGVHAFPKGISLKVNVIEQLEFELGYFDFTDQHFNHYTTETPPSVLNVSIESNNFLNQSLWPINGFDMISLHINHLRLLNAKTSLYIYIYISNIGSS